LNSLRSRAEIFHENTFLVNFSQLDNIQRTLENTIEHIQKNTSETIEKKNRNAAEVNIFIERIECFELRLNFL
jgi:hypothetical protein